MASLLAILTFVLIWFTWKFFTSWLWWLLLFVLIIWLLKVFFWAGIILLVLCLLGGVGSQFRN
ncbi:hypothetical protein ACYATP_08260 [Lactobacillaceae bacterium Melli_B4]